MTEFDAHQNQKALDELGPLLNGKSLNVIANPNGLWTLSVVLDSGRMAHGQARSFWEAFGLLERDIYQVARRV